VSEPLWFFAPGLPIAQGSGYAAKNIHTGKCMIVMTTAKLTAWRKVVATKAWSARNRLHDPRAWTAVATPVILEIVFCCQKPKSHKQRCLVDVFKSTASDLDKLTRAAGDALEQSGVLANDSRIVSVSAIKLYREVTGCQIRLSHLTEESAGWLLRHHQRHHPLP
jgi:Holliday junction resolvase RusA-like endonuclease